MGNIFTKKSKKVTIEHVSPPTPPRVSVSPPTPPRVSVMEPSPEVSPLSTDDSLSPQVSQVSTLPTIDEKDVSENLPSSSETSTSSSPTTATLVDQIPHYVTPLIPSIIQVQPCEFPPSLESSRKQSLEEGEIFVPPTMIIVSPRNSISLQDPLEPIEECTTTESNATPTV